MSKLSEAEFEAIVKEEMRLSGGAISYSISGFSLDVTFPTKSGKGAPWRATLDFDPEPMGWFTVTEHWYGSSLNTPNYPSGLGGRIMQRIRGRS